MYSRYFYYKKQGLQTIGFPLPILGNVIQVFPAFYRRSIYSRGVNVELYNRAFNGKPPKIFAEFSLYSGNIIINDPEIANEFWGPKHKYMDKHPKILRLMTGFLGDEALTFQATDENWAMKRKVLAQAFYKNKLSGKMESILRSCLHHFE